MSRSIELYLIRHGIAVERSPESSDAERCLTDFGKQKTKQIAHRLAQLSLQFDELLTSPLVRAEQTAAILHQAGLAKKISICPFLAPGGSFQAWLIWLAHWPATQVAQGAIAPPDSPQRLALVGHQPDLGAWAECLLWGHPGDKLVLKKAGIIGLSVLDTSSPVGNTMLFWLTPPKLLR